MALGLAVFSAQPRWPGVLVAMHRRETMETFAMCRFLLALSVAVIGIWECSQRHEQPVPAPASPAPRQQAADTPDGDYLIGAPVSHENLTIFPISSKTPKHVDRFITLDEGLAAGT